MREDGLNIMMAGADGYSYIVTEYEGYNNVADISFEKNDGRLSKSNVLLLPELIFQDDEYIDGAVVEESTKLDTQQVDEFNTTAREREIEGIEAPSASNKICTSASCCAVCINDFENGDILTLLLPCNHAFHKECIVPWLTNHKGFCPLCMEIVNPRGRKEEHSEKNSNPNIRRNVATKKMRWIFRAAGRLRKIVLPNMSHR